MVRRFGLVLLLIAAPLLALAQITTDIPSSVDLPTTAGGWVAFLIKVVVLPMLVLGSKALWGWIEARKGNDALGRLMAALDVIGQPLWDRQMARVQEALADGVITAEERAALLRELTGELPRLVHKDTLALAMKALGVPDLGGLASWVLSKLLARWSGAHDITDPSVPTALAGIYPAPSDAVALGYVTGGAPDASDGRG